MEALVANLSKTVGSVAEELARTKAELAQTRQLMATPRTEEPHVSAAAPKAAPSVATGGVVEAAGEEGGGGIEAASASVANTAASFLEASVNDVDPQLDASYNLYSYCVFTISRSHSPSKLVRSWLFLFVVLPILQLTLAFGFYDTSLLQWVLADSPCTQDVVDLSMFYLTKRTDSGVPRINVVVSLVAIFMLCFYMKDDSNGTLSSCIASECVPSASIREVGRTWAFRLLPLHWGWAVRAVAMPVYAGCGSAISFAAASGADGIVLNSVAIGFVFELDDLFCGFASVRTAISGGGRLISALQPQTPPSVGMRPTDARMHHPRGCHWLLCPLSMSWMSR
jgi:hypothetical protein